MGQGQSCANLNEFSNACEMHKCMKKVSGLASNSASPTDTWILSFNPDTKYDNYSIKNGFLKFFIDPSSLPNNYNYLHILKGLKYEIKIYKDIVRPLIDLSICPNFIKYLGSGEQCSYDSMVKMLENHTTDKNTGMLKSRVEVERSFRLNVQYMYSLKQGRPSINAGSSQFNLPDYRTLVNEGMKDANEYKYDLLVNEAISSDAYTLQDFLEMLNPGGMNRNPKRLSRQNWSLIFQVIIACYAMALSKMTHNDLHFGNIYIEPYSKPLNYILGPKHDIYSIDIGMKAMLYDFDRAYSERIGTNVMNDNYFAGFSQSNEIIPVRDMVKIFGYIYMYVGDTDKEAIQEIVTKPGHGKWLADVYTHGTFLQDPYAPKNPVTGKNHALKDIDYRTHCNTADRILENIASITNTKVTSNKRYILADTKNLYICIPEYFDVNGKITGYTAAAQYSYGKQGRELYREYKELYDKSQDEKETIAKEVKEKCIKIIEQKDVEYSNKLTELSAREQKLVAEANDVIALKDKEIARVIKMKDEEIAQVIKMKDEEIRLKDEEIDNLTLEIFKGDLSQNEIMFEEDTSMGFDEVSMDF